MKTTLPSILLGSAALALVVDIGFDAPGSMAFAQTDAAQEVPDADIDAAGQPVEEGILPVEQTEVGEDDLPEAQAEPAAADDNLTATEPAAVEPEAAPEAEPTAEAPPAVEEQAAPELSGEAVEPTAAEPAESVPLGGEEAGIEEPAPEPAEEPAAVAPAAGTSEPDQPEAEAPQADTPAAAAGTPEPAADITDPAPVATPDATAAGAPEVEPETAPEADAPDSQPPQAAGSPAEPVQESESAAEAAPEQAEPVAEPIPTEPEPAAAAPAQTRPPAARPAEAQTGEQAQPAPAAEAEAADPAAAESVAAETLSREALEAAQQESEEEAVEAAAAEEAAKSEEQREREREDRLRILGAAAAGAAVGAILPELGGRLIGQQGDRVIIQQGDEFVVRKDETQRLLTGGGTAEVEELAEGRTQVTVERPDGTQIVTLRDAGGTLLRRVRRLPNGDEVVLFDERDSGAATVADLDDRLPFIPPEERGTTYLSRASVEEILDALNAQPATPVEGSYSLREVRQSERLRWQVPSLALDAVTFESASAELGRDQIAALDAMGRALAEFIGENPGEVFLIEGHTDATGADLYNLTLSDRRAETVARLLTDFYSVPPENLITQGYGEQDLRVATLGSSRENRRVEVRRITPLLQ